MVFTDKSWSGFLGELEKKIKRLRIKALVSKDKASANAEGRQMERLLARLKSLESGEDRIEYR